MQLEKQTKEDLTTIEKVMLMVYNKPFDMIKDVFGDNHHASYLDDQRDMMINNFGRWWSRLDVAHRVRVVNVSNKCYGEESKDRIERY